MKTFLILTALTSVLLLSGCNTVKGLGQDISGSASWTQEKMSGDSSTPKSSDSDYVQNPPQFPKGN
jgi:predicted small secreted protein